MSFGLRAGIGVLGLAVSLPAQALLETCAVTALPVAFGSYNPLGSSPVDTTGQVTVACTAVLSIAVSYSISLSQGGSGSFSPRKMSLLANRINYNLYTSSGYSTIWGDGTGGTATVNDSYGLALLAVTRNYTVYARMPAAQNVAAGIYTDTLQVTVNY